MIHYLSGVELGIFNLSVEEKLSQQIIDTYHHLGVLTEYSKGELVNMVRPLLGMYQEGIAENDIDVLDQNNAQNVARTADYLYVRSQLPSAVIRAFLKALWDTTQAGIIPLKHIDPAEAETVAQTKLKIPGIPDLTPNLLKSVLDVDLPEFLSKNILSISLITGGAIFLYFQSRGPHGRTA